MKKPNSSGKSQGQAKLGKGSNRQLSKGSKSHIDSDVFKNVPQMDSLQLSDNNLIEPQSSHDQNQLNDGDIESSKNTFRWAIDSEKQGPQRKGWESNAPLIIPNKEEDPMKDITRRVMDEVRKSREIMIEHQNEKQREKEERQLQQMELNQNIVVDTKQLKNKDKNKGYATARVDARPDEQILGLQQKSAETTSLNAEFNSKTVEPIRSKMNSQDECSQIFGLLTPTQRDENSQLKQCKKPVEKNVIETPEDLYPTAKAAPEKNK